MPTITQLEYIVAVDTYRHFGLAAQRTYISQPTLSMQIKKAEEELGVVLFDRSKQPIIPTDVGVAIILQARIILREMQRLQEVVQDFQNDVSGELRVGIIPTLAPYLLPLFVGDFVRTYPHLDLKIIELTTTRIVEDLLNDTLDVGILVTPLQDEQIQQIPLFYEELKVYCHENHPFRQQEKIQVSDLRDHRLWLLSQGHCFRNQVINLCAGGKGAALELPFEYESGSLEGLRRLVDKEGGCTLLPELAVWGNTTQTRSLQAPIPLREVGLVYVRSFAKKRVVQFLAEHIRKAVPKELLDAKRGQIVEWE